MRTKEAISIDIQLTILKPVEQVFAAVVNPVPFFVEKTSGPLAEGKTVQWKFPEMAVQVPVTVTQLVPNNLIRFEWGGREDGINTCEFKFSRPQDLNPGTKTDGEATTVSITESGWPDDEKGRAASYRNCMGWTHMTCALKAYLEYGANLRKGSFLHMKF